MRLLVTGANGQVGWELNRRLISLGEVIALGRAQCDLAQPERLPDIVRSIKPDVIVNAAAYTAVDKAEQEEELAFTVNGKSVGALAEEARRAGALLIHYSTDYVFDGNKSAPYSEEDTPCPINAYGRSKLAGERAVPHAADGYIILRTSWIYAARGRNFLQTVLRLAREREELQIVCDQVGAPTWARDIAEATALVVQTAIRERREGRFASGLFHMTASGAASWYDFAAAILEHGNAYGLLSAARRPRLYAITSEQYRLPAARPKNSRLAGDRLRERFGIVLPDWREALPLCLKEIKACEP
ncbi:MAG: dTDP-4-dehydrorhamnose reductase [Xanthobacteraceae bacterium]